jgi:hypothetical protein
LSVTGCASNGEWWFAAREVTIASGSSLDVVCARDDHGAKARAENHAFFEAAAKDARCAADKTVGVRFQIGFDEIERMDHLDVAQL